MTISDVVSHDHAATLSMKWSKTQQILIIGGTRSTHLLAKNLMGPSNTTQSRSRAKHNFKCKPCLPAEENFQKLKEIYEQIKISRNITGPVLVAEDETVIVSQVLWDSASDECWGWCGQKGFGHKCDPAIVNVVVIPRCIHKTYRTTK